MSLSSLVAAVVEAGLTTGQAAEAEAAVLLQRG